MYGGTLNIFWYILCYNEIRQSIQLMNGLVSLTNSYVTSSETMKNKCVLGRRAKVGNYNDSNFYIWMSERAKIYVTCKKQIISHAYHEPINHGQLYLSQQQTASIFSYLKNDSYAGHLFAAKAWRLRPYSLSSKASNRQKVSKPRDWML